MSRPWPDESGRLWYIDSENNQKTKAEPESRSTLSVAAELASYRSCPSKLGCSSTPAHVLLEALWARDTASTVPSLILGGGVSMEITRGQCRETKEEVGVCVGLKRYARGSCADPRSHGSYLTIRLSLHVQTGLDEFKCLFLCVD